MEKIRLPQTITQVKNLLAGEWVSGSGKTKNVFSPYTGKAIGQFNESTNSDVAKIIKSSSIAQKLWSRTPLKERTLVMFKFREVLLREAPAISQVVALESGKTVAEAYAGVMKGVEVLEFAISLQNLDSGAKMEVSRGVQCEYRREPIGVVVNITPFNFPAMVPMWTIPIVLTLGNSYIWKPSDKTPLTSVLLANVLKEAGLPDGVFSVVQGGRECVEALIDHPTVKAVGFVGSSKVAKMVYSRATALGKRALCLGGAKNHIILLPDADASIAGKGISDSFTGCAGQRCMAASVLLAIGDCQEQISKILDRAKSMKLGSDMGAIITKEQVNFLNEAITKAEQAGAKIILDGRVTEVESDFDGGYWMGPTILEGIEPNSEASKIELFGPILSIIHCKNLSEAIAIENANDYGNACSVFTNSGAAAERVSMEAKAGMVGINIGVPVPREPFSFGGINESKFGHGDITGEHSLNFWSNIKKVTTKWETQSDNNWMS